MQVSAISSSNSFGRGYSGISDEDAQRIALNVAIDKAQKRQRNTRLAYASIPLIAGLSAAILTKGRTIGAKQLPPVSQILGKVVSGRAAKLANGLKSAGNWLGMMGIVVTGGLGIRALENKSEKYRNFRLNHPALSFLTDMAMFTGAVVAAPWAGNKLYSKLGRATKIGIAKNVGKLAEGLNNFKAPKFVNSGLDAISKHTPEALKGLKGKISEHTPDLVKDLGKGLLYWAPELTLFTTFFSSLSQPARAKADFIKEYNNLKNS